MNNILVIEDEQNIQKMLVEALSTKGYQAIPASDGSLGYNLASKKSFDAIILDYHLPKTNGLSVCQKLRKNGVTTPILIVTSSIELEFKIKFLQSGADDYITKPFTQTEIVARLQAVLRRSKTYHETMLCERSICMNTISQCVTKDDKAIHLTKKEYALLEYLLRFKGTILPRSTLFEHVWNKNTDPFSNTLEAHVVSLRKKLGVKRNELIKSVSSKGYMLETL